MNNNIKAHTTIAEKIKKILVIEYITTNLYQQHNKHIEQMKKNMVCPPEDSN